MARDFFYVGLNLLCNVYKNADFSSVFHDLDKCCNVVPTHELHRALLSDLAHLELHLLVTNEKNYRAKLLANQSSQYHSYNCCKETADSKVSGSTCINFMM